MGQDPINQRLKNLVEALGLNVRSFSIKLGISDSTARNYIDRGSKPPADFIATVINHIENIDPRWLLTGEGTMFTSVAEPAAPHQKNFGSNNNVTQHTGTGAVHQAHGESSPLQQQLEGAQREIELLKSQLQDKERIIQLLENQLKK